MIIEEMFSNFIICEDLNLNLSSLKEFAYQTQRTSEGRVLSNVGGWQSKDFFVDEVNLRPLSLEIEKIAFDIRNMFSMENKLNLGNTWININRKNNFNRPHYHALSFFSGTFYVKTPKNCGRLCLSNPMTNFESYCANIKFNDSNKFNIHGWNIEPRENLLVLFPSWVQHYVEPNLSQEDRISISFNLVVDRN